jgi:diguanylate cyclase (GGDEF)-like protein
MMGRDLGPPAQIGPARAVMTREFLQKRRIRYGQFGVIGVLVVVLIGGGLYLADIGKRLQRNAELDHQAQAFLLAMVDGETAVRGFVITGGPVYLDPYRDNFSRANDLLADLLTSAPPRVGRHFDAAALAELVARRQQSLARTIELRATRGFEAAQAYVGSHEGKLQMDEIRRQIHDLSVAVDRESAVLNQRLTFSLQVIAPAVAFLVVLTLILAALQTRQMRRTLVAARIAEAEAERRGQQLEALGDMADELHAAADRGETYRIIQHHGARLLPGISASLFVYNNSRDQLRRSAGWGDVAEGRDGFAPADCWAIRKGKAQVNHAERSVQCAHAGEGHGASLCLPITARGQTVGLLSIAGAPLAAIEEGGEVHRMASTLCEQVALALVNLDLRERLENQALRDTLTNLYNRRYLEEASERELSRAERTDAPLSILAIDIDHFKRFNDQHGHAAGDEVLKRVAAHIVDTCRATDLVCRLGGEELLVLLPDTDAAGAAAIAETLRVGVSQLRIRWHSGELPPVTISIGVAAFPVHARKFGVLHSLADAALYRAKQDGRDRVRVWEAGAGSRELPAAAASPNIRGPDIRGRQMSIYDIPVRRIDGKDASLADYKGDVLLVVNVASKCGLTPQYDALEKVYRAYRDKGFQVLGFPANNFAGQEPGSDAEIREFCSTRFDVDFPMFSKISVAGEDRHPLYRELIAAHPGRTAKPDSALKKILDERGLAPSDETDVMWNFEKFLVSRDGEVVGRFAPDIAPDDPALTGAIEKELAA